MNFLKGFAKDLFFSLNQKPLGECASILSYHNIGNDKAYFTVKPGVFEKQLKYIKSGDFCTVLLSDLAKKIQKKEDIGNCVALTFNDGYKSFYTEVFPLLQKYEIPATMFVAVEYLETSIETTGGFTFQTLSVAEMKEMQESGLVEFMPQTQNTVRLGGVVFEYAAESIEAARKNVESLIGKEASIFAYPKGDYTDQLRDYLKEHNWGGAVALKEGLVGSESDPFALPRNSVDSRTSFTQFKGKLSHAINAYRKVKK